MSGCQVTRNRLKTASKDLIKAAGGEEAAASIAGKGKSQIHNYGNKSMPDLATIEVVARLEDATFGQPQHPHVTRLLCELAGGVFVPLPQMPEGEEAPALMLARLAAELGDVSRSIAEGLADNGKLDPPEAAAALGEVGDVERITAQLRMLLQSSANGSG